MRAAATVEGEVVRLCRRLQLWQVFRGEHVGHLRHLVRDALAHFRYGDGEQSGGC